jgi:hypothetical protein
MKKCSNKKCRHGNTLQPLSNFYKQEHSGDGMQSHCKDCYREKYKSTLKEKRNSLKWMGLLIGG